VDAADAVVERHEDEVGYPEGGLRSTACESKDGGEVAVGVEDAFGDVQADCEEGEDEDEGGDDAICVLVYVHGS
jgi:hypothetical protein